MREDHGAEVGASSANNSAPPIITRTERRPIRSLGGSPWPAWPAWLAGWLQAG